MTTQENVCYNARFVFNAFSQRGNMATEAIYIFLDEGGNLDFSLKGSRYFTLSCVSMRRPFAVYGELDALKYDLIEDSANFQYFHCNNDKKWLRKKVFGILGNNLPKLQINSLVVEKCKTEPLLQKPEKFYPLMLGHLLQHVAKGGRLNNTKKVIIITDALPIAKKRKAIEKAIKTTLKEKLPRSVAYQIWHHASMAHYGLQIADYCNWAIFRKWERGDEQYYRVIASQIQRELDIFATTETRYY